MNKVEVEVEVLRSLSQVRESIYTSKELTCIELLCIETTGNISSVDSLRIVSLAARRCIHSYDIILRKVNFLDIM